MAKVANKTINLNKNASAFCGDNTKVRVRMVGGVLEIRPTNRVEGKNLPKGEILVDLRLKSQAVRALRFTLPSEFDLSLGSNLRALPGKRGWIALVAVDPAAAREGVVIGQPHPAGASVSDR